MNVSWLVYGRTKERVNHGVQMIWRIKYEMKNKKHYVIQANNIKDLLSKLPKTAKIIEMDKSIPKWWENKAMELRKEIKETK